MADDGRLGQTLLLDIAGDLLGDRGGHRRSRRSGLGVAGGRRPGEAIDLDAVDAPAHAVLGGQMVHRPLPDLGRGAEAGDQDDVAPVHVAIDRHPDAVRLEAGVRTDVRMTLAVMGSMPVLSDGGRRSEDKGRGGGAHEKIGDGHGVTPLWISRL